MSDTRLAGTVRWAIVPHVPAPPFRLYAGPGSDPVVVPETDTLIAAARRGGDVELSYIVPGKTRPILLLGDPPLEHHQEVAAARLLRLSRLPVDDQERVRAGREALLFHLDPGRFDLPEESAVMVSALVRVHAEAIGSGPPAGRLEDNEMCSLAERIVQFYSFDIRGLVERRVHELAERARAREAGG